MEENGFCAQQTEKGVVYLMVCNGPGRSMPPTMSILSSSVSDRKSDNNAMSTEELCSPGLVTELQWNGRWLWTLSNDNSRWVGRKCRTTFLWRDVGARCCDWCRGWL